MLKKTTIDSTAAVACDLGTTLSAQELQELHRASVIRHANILADNTTNAETKIIAYFNDLLSFLESHRFQGCSFSNSLVINASSDPKITKEVNDHKEFTREFFISLSSELTTPSRINHLGEHLFLLYSGATTEAQNLQDTWPVERSIEIVRQLLLDEQEIKEISLQQSSNNNI